MGLSDGTVGAELVKARDGRGDATFLMFGDDTYTYADAEERSARVGAGLRGLGVARGDHVALIMPNAPEFLWAWFGAARVGAPVVPVNTALKGDGLVHILDHSDSETVVVHADLLERFTDVRGRLPKVRRAVVVGGDGTGAASTGAAGTRTDGFEDTSWDDLIGSPAAGGAGVDDASIAPGDLMMVMYTSGTTGLPKGVTIPHQQIIGAPFLASFAGLNPSDVFYTCLPLFHANAALISIWGAFGLGTRVALSPRFSASRFWDDVRRYGATQFNSLGAMMPILFKQPERPDDADNPCRVVLSAACPKEIWEAFERRFGVEIIEFYGTVEGGLSMAGPDAPVGSIGKPLPINEMRIVRDDDTECDPYEVGEIVSRPVGGPPTVEYYKNPDATAEKVRGGWMRSGDAGYADAEGYLWFADRKKDFLRRRGENISSFEVEKVLNDHPDVLESAVYAVPAELGEDDVMAALVVRAGATLDPEDLMRHCEKRMAYFMVPRYLRVVDELEKTGTHRVQKQGLRDQGVTDDTWDRDAAGYTLER